MRLTDSPTRFPALAADLPLEEADGNSVILDIGDGAFVLYAHLKPGSVRVRTGTWFEPARKLRV